MSNHVYIVNKYPESEESLNKTLGIFIKKVNKEGHLKILKERNRGYKKPSQIRHEQYNAILHKQKINKRKGNNEKDY